MPRLSSPRGPSPLPPARRRPRGGQRAARRPRLGDQARQARRVPRHPAPPLRVRADRHHARARTTSRRRINQHKPKVPGLHHPLQARTSSTPARTRCPRVDVIHLHHGVWLINGYPTFAAGEEKTILPAPARLRLPLRPERQLDHELHDPQPDAEADEGVDHLRHRLRARQRAPPPRRSRRRTPLWMDVAGLSAYPVFDAIKGQGKHGKFTFPDQAQRRRQKADIGPRPRVHGRAGHDAPRHRRAPAPGRPLHGPEGHPRRQDARSCSARWPSTSSRPAPSRGTCR